MMFVPWEFASCSLPMSFTEPAADTGAMDEHTLLVTQARGEGDPVVLTPGRAARRTG
jgi:hypothetical protein